LKTAAMTPATTVEHSSRVIGCLIIFYVALIAYVSLSPFKGWQSPTVGIFEFLLNGWPRYYTRFDMAINFVAYLPFGLLLYAYQAPRTTRTITLLISVAAGVLLSLTMEALQGFLRDRISSNVDFLSNSAGCLVGALLSAWLGRNTSIQTLLQRWRRELLLPGVTVDVGLALICVWLISQLNPSIPFFGAGVVTDTMRGYDEGFDYQPVPDTPFALGTALNFCGVGLLVTTLLRVRSHALVFVQVLTGVAFCLKLVAANTLLRPEISAQWHSEETLTGLAIGFVALLPLSFLQLSLRIYLAAVLILAGGMLSKMAGNYVALSDMLRLFDWPYGQLLQFTGLTLYLNEIWPLVALIFLFWYWLRQQMIDFTRL
jgi:VanZ family protein